MKLKFKTQDFQTQAVNAVVDLFTGQENTQSTFSVVDERQTSLLTEMGQGNALYIDQETLAANMHTVQKRNGLPLTDLEATAEGTLGTAARRQFCIEMETGTGKTYVYTKTIFELNRKYGFTKFVIVVPSVAIREGVYKSFEITREHFGLQYDNVPCRYFIYNSAKLSDVRQFATSSNIEVMIINIDAFKKAENIINQAQDRLGGETAMGFIRNTHPIVIIDEPQSVDNTPKAKEAIAALNPLCVLRYSATHREKINLLYRLTPVDAYEMGLVKQIAVSSNQIAGGFNQAYVRLLSVSNDKGFKARVELDVKGKTGAVTRKAVTVKPGDDLFLLSGQRGLYEGYTVVGIDCTPDFEHIEFGNTQEVKLGKAIGDVDENIVKKAQIRRTIETHLDKELRYLEKGIKVLSLFFIDKVDKYRHPKQKTRLSSCLLFWIVLTKKMHPTGLGDPNRSPAQRVRFGKEEQQNECALTFVKSRSKRYDVCSDVVRVVGLEPTRKAREPKSRMSTNSIIPAYSLFTMTGSNSFPVGQHRNPARLPIPPYPHLILYYSVHVPCSADTQSSIVSASMTTR